MLASLIVNWRCVHHHIAKQFLAHHFFSGWWKCLQAMCYYVCVSGVKLWLCVTERIDHQLPRTTSRINKDGTASTLQTGTTTIAMQVALGIQCSANCSCSLRTLLGICNGVWCYAHIQVHCFVHSAMHWAYTYGSVHECALNGLMEY